jgi:ATP-dependent helicase/DNAse subunit B
MEAEVRGVLTQIKGKLSEGCEPDEIVLITRDDAFYGPIVLAVAWEYGLPVRALYAVPLSETKLGAWLRLLLESILNGLPFESTARLLALPLGPGLTDKQWRDVRRHHPSGVSKWKTSGVNLSGLAWPKNDTRAGWIARLQNQMKVSDLGRRAGYWAREVIAFHTLQNELSVLAEPALEPVSLTAFADEVLELLSILTVPAQPGSGGVQLHTPLSVFGARYRHVYVIGMSEGLYPAPVREDALLDFHERRSLAKDGFEIESAVDAPRRESLSFYSLLLTASESFTLSFPRVVGDREALPSPYIHRLGIDPNVCEEPPATVSSIEEARRIHLRLDGHLEDAVMAPARRALFIEKKRESVEACDEYDGVISLPLDLTQHVWNVSQLTNIGQCPFRWFTNKLLKLTEAEEADTALSSGLRGRLYHKVLEIALGWAIKSEDPRRGMLDRLNEAFRKAEKELGIPTLPAWEAQRTEHLKVLRLAIEGPDFLSEGTEVLALEKWFEGEWYGLKVNGVVDRLDRTADGLVLIDYKTSSSPPTGPKNDEGKTRLDIQLPLYVQVAAQSLFPEEKVASAYYYSLTKGRILKKAKMDDLSPLEVFAGRVKGHLETGHFPVDPDAERTACEFCDYDLVCRKGARLSRKGVSGETNS